ncbi:serine/arginine repetitive matrix protein 1-like [Triticum dicoccoides]|uniref:serine/arginine repetitive matrix protein 1-like n=1 Tax=Triticum dicoccoides TaxID=85692 RepID=UPI001891E241|nr:serine/arginine repetitive matrix protein 1-like [Triticum dicoccoides]
MPFCKIFWGTAASLSPSQIPPPPHLLPHPYPDPSPTPPVHSRSRRPTLTVDDPCRRRTPPRPPLTLAQFNPTLHAHRCRRRLPLPPSPPSHPWHSRSSPPPPPPSPLPPRWRFPPSQPPSRRRGAAPAWPRESLSAGPLPRPATPRLRQLRCCSTRARATRRSRPGADAEAVPAHHDLDAKWNACLDLSIRRIAYAPRGEAGSGRWRGAAAVVRRRSSFVADLRRCRRAFVCVLVALLCLFYDAAFGLRLRASQAEAPVPADLALSSLPICIPQLVSLRANGAWFDLLTRYAVCAGVRREALRADLVPGTGPPAPARPRPAASTASSPCPLATCVSSDFIASTRRGDESEGDVTAGYISCKALVL